MRFIILSLFIVVQVNAQTQSVLWLGNSYTAVNNLPNLLYQLALSGGDTLQCDSYTPGGYTLQMHTQDTNTIQKINQQPWSYVIVQAQSQEPSLDTPYVVANVFPYARMLDSMIHANDSCTQTCFYMTWGRKNGDASNCAAYPPVCTYAGMQDQLRNRYLQMAYDNNAMVAPCGEAWRDVIATNPAFDLYMADESHPSLYGSYLNACVFYASIYRRSPVGLTYTAGLTATDALFLQQYAASCVLDSMTLWNTNVYHADPSFGVTWMVGTTYQFDASAISSSDQWSNGSGFAPGSATATFTFPGNGTYTVCHVVNNGCLSDTSCQNIVVGPQAVGSPPIESELQISVSPAEGVIEINSLTGIAMEFTITDMTGRTVSNGKLIPGKNLIETSGYSGGVYNLIICGSDEVVARKIVIAASE